MNREFIPTIITKLEAKLKELEPKLTVKEYFDTYQRIKTRISYLSHLYSDTNLPSYGTSRLYECSEYLSPDDCSRSVSKFESFKCANDIYKVLGKLDSSSIVTALKLLQLVKKIVLPCPNRYILVDLCTKSPLSGVLCQFMLPVLRTICISPRVIEKPFHLINNYQFIKGDISSEYIYRQMRGIGAPVIVITDDINIHNCDSICDFIHRGANEFVVSNRHNTLYSINNAAKLKKMLNVPNVITQDIPTVMLFANLLYTKLKNSHNRIDARRDLFNFYFTSIPYKDTLMSARDLKGPCCDPTVKYATVIPESMHSNN